MGKVVGGLENESLLLFEWPLGPNSTPPLSHMTEGRVSYATLLNLELNIRYMQMPPIMWNAELGNSVDGSSKQIRWSAELLQILASSVNK